MQDKLYIKNLIERCTLRDPDAWNKLVGLATPLVDSVIKSKLWRLNFRYQKSDIENLRQDIFLSIWEKNKLEVVNNKENFMAWLCAMASNMTSNYIRSIKPFDLPRANSVSDLISGNAALPSQGLLDKDTRGEIRRALKYLNHKEKIIIKLFFLYEKKYKDISRILDIPLGTVSVYAKRAKTKLRKSLRL